MFNVLLLGAGKIGACISAMLLESKDYNVTVADQSEAACKKLSSHFKDKIIAQALDTNDNAALKKILTGKDAVISALPFFCNEAVAKEAVQLGVHYFDLTEDIKTTKAVTDIAKSGDVIVMPQCGLAPGFVGIVANHINKLFDKTVSVKLRVGALPVYPTNRMKYSLTWSTAGLINQYCNPCEAIRDGKIVSLEPLEGCETISIDGTEYESFNTSGGLGGLASALVSSGRDNVNSIDYKTLRYPGHRELVMLLLQDLNLKYKRELLGEIFEAAMPRTLQDKCIVFVEGIGLNENQLMQKTYSSTVYAGKLAGDHYGAIQLTTAAGICAPMDLVLTNSLNKKSGHVASHEVPLEQFLKNRFGKVYLDTKAAEGIL